MRVPRSRRRRRRGAQVSTVQARVAGLGSTLPAPAARTWKVCDPLDNPELELGEAQGRNGLASSRHWKPAGSLELKENLALRDATMPVGPPRSVVSSGLTATP